MENNRKKLGTVLVVAIVITIIAFIVYIISITFSATKAIAQGEKLHDISQIENSIQTNVRPVSEENTIPIENRIKIYSITYKTTANSDREYMLDNDFKINTSLTINNSPEIKFTVNNGNHQFRDTLINDDEQNEDKKQETRFKFNYYRVGDYLCFINHDIAGGGTAHLYVVDKSGNLFKDISDVDLDKGIKANRVEFGDDRITIYTTGSIENRTYTYKIDLNGNVDFNNPTINM